MDKTESVNTMRRNETDRFYMHCKGYLKGTEEQWLVYY